MGLIKATLGSVGGVLESAPAASVADGWKCSCGAIATGKFCPECGSKKPEPKPASANWTCPQCGNQDQNKMNVARRTCGYIGTQFWNQGRTQEIKDRVLHL